MTTEVPYFVNVLKILKDIVVTDSVGAAEFEQYRNMYCRMS
jgi:hypothetical protein